MGFCEAVAELFCVFALRESAQLKGVIERGADGLDPVRAFDHFESNRDRAGTDHSQRTTGAVGQVDNSSLSERAAVSDGDLRRVSIIQISHHDPAAQWQRLVRGGWIGWVVNGYAR